VDHALEPFSCRCIRALIPTSGRTHALHLARPVHTSRSDRLPRREPVRQDSLSVYTPVPTAWVSLEYRDFRCRENGPTLATIRLSRKWGTRLWWYGQMWATQPIDARYQLFLSVEGKGSCGFRYLKNHPAEAVERKPKPTRTMTVIRTPTANVIMLPLWS
jgi:hypothetical protein